MRGLQYPQSNNLTQRLLVVRRSLQQALALSECPHDTENQTFFFPSSFFSSFSLNWNIVASSFACVPVGITSSCVSQQLTPHKGCSGAWGSAELGRLVLSP